MQKNVQWHLLRVCLKMKHCHLVCDYGYDDCFSCNHLQQCFPKTYKLKMENVDKRWKEKYGDDF